MLFISKRFIKKIVPVSFQQALFSFCALSEMKGTFQEAETREDLFLWLGTTTLLFRTNKYPQFLQKLLGKPVNRRIFKVARAKPPDDPELAFFNSNQAVQGF